MANAVMAFDMSVVYHISVTTNEEINDDFQRLTNAVNMAIAEQMYCACCPSCGADTYYDTDCPVCMATLEFEALKAKDPTNSNMHPVDVAIITDWLMDDEDMTWDERDGRYPQVNDL